MRLLQLDDKEGLTLTPDLINNIPPYAILSHTWGVDGEEVTFQDVLQKRGHRKPGYEKILFCGRQAKRDGLDHFWVDTCCIDKTSSAELAEAINSMFRWYRDAAECYVYLQDVSMGSVQGGQGLRPWDIQFRGSRWFTRGWTLQELLAPISVRFYSSEGALLGTKLSLENAIHAVTNIKIPALRGDPLDEFPVLDRMHWSSDRQTTKAEDAAYCLLGIFGVYIAPIYGEGKTNAMNRLRRAIEERTGIPAFPSEDHRLALASDLLPALPQERREAHLLVPFGKNDEFVGREYILGELVEKILPSSKQYNCQRTVLKGLGGVGKTQIALEAAYRIREQDPNCSIFWVPAISMTTFENAYRSIGQALGTPGIEDDKADVKLLVKTALEKCSSHWLLIIDNVDDISLLDDEGLRKYIPYSRNGSILFTTRNHEVAVELDASPENIHLIGKMTEAEALELLQSRLQERQYRDTQVTSELLLHLAYLPLAIKQASAYMAKTRATTAIYLKYCLESDEKQMKLLNTGFEDRGRYSRETNAIATTWLISFQHLERKYPLAVEYLKFICFLAEKDIPTMLLPYEEDEGARDEAISMLEGYAFISIQDQGDAFDIHRLVRLAARNWVKPEWDVRYTKAIQRLAKVYPYPKHENRQTWMAYMPHAEVALVDRKECRDKEAQADLLYVVAESHTSLGKYAEAEKMYRETLELRKLVLGPEHPDTLAGMNNLANVLDRQGKYEEAEEMHRQTLELKKSVLGPEHPSTLDSMNALAIVLNSAGECGESEILQRRALQGYRTHLGAEHPRTLDSMNNLALALNRQGKYEEAEGMHRQALELTKSVLGPEHPSTLSSMNNLANVLDSQGKYEEAEEMHRETLELKKSVLGPEHPSTLSSMNNLANVLDSQGNYEEAEEMHRETLELKKSVLGLEHPSTLDSMNALAIVLNSAGECGESEILQRRALQGYRTHLGAEHPRTLDSMNNLALALNRQGKYEEAEGMHRQALELTKSVLGPEHPSTLSSMNNLAIVLDSQGKYEEAEEMHREELELTKSVLGPEHPSTLDSMNNLANVLDSQGNYEEAEEIYQVALQLQTRVLGPAHPSTLRTSRNLQQLLAAKACDTLGETSDDSGDDGGVSIQFT